MTESNNDMSMFISVAQVELEQGPSKALVTGSSPVGDIKTINKLRVLKFKFTVYKSTDYSGLEYAGYADWKPS